MRDDPPKSFTNHLNNQLRNGPSTMPTNVTHTQNNHSYLIRNTPIHSLTLSTPYANDDSYKEEICNIIEDDISTEIRDHGQVPNKRSVFTSSDDPNNLTAN